MVFGQANPLVGPDEINEGAAATHVVELSRALSRRGHDVRIYVRDDGSDVSLTGGVTVEAVPAGPATPIEREALLPHMGNLGRALAGRWADGPFQPDVVHAHTWLSGLAVLTATADRRIPVVVTYHWLGSVQRRHQGEQDPSPSTRVGLERTLGNMTDRVIAQSEDEVAELGRLGVHRADIVVVPSGVDVEMFTPGSIGVPGTSGTPGTSETPGMLGASGALGPSGALGTGETRRRILTVGELTERKGFADLIAALPLIPDAELVIVGGPPPEALAQDKGAQRLQELAERAGVADRVRLVGRVRRADMPTWYRSAAVVACATRYGPAPLVPLEAMACGVPVVAYGLGGVADSVIDGVTGVVVPDRDVRGLAGGLRALLRDNVRRMSLSSAAVDRVRSRYTWDRVAFDTERVYSRVLGRSEPDEDEAFSEASA
jgi:D-inositol-3-phosphate glycosyltransferase